MEAASLRGKPIAFVAFGPWTKPWRMPPKEEGANDRGAILVLLGISIVTTVAVWLFSRTNSVRGQGDQRGASRLGTFVFVVQMGMWICRAHFGSLDGVFGTCLLAVVTSLAYSYIVRMIYLALEPWVRRRWPHTLISWANLLGHRIRDPIVGRDVLVGLAIGISWGLINQVARLLTPGAWPELARDDLLLGARDTVGSWLIHIPGSIRDTLVFFLLVFVLRLVLRKQWLAGAGFVLIFTGLQFFSHGSNTGDIISALIVYTLIAFSVLRFGLLTLGVALFTAGVMGGVPVTASPSDWYFGSAMFMLATLAALAVWSFFVSIGGQKLLKENLLD